MTTLGALLERASVEAPLSAAVRALEVRSVELDSRACTPGSVFFAMSGTKTTGEAFVADAVARGAVCVVAASEVGAPISVVVDRAELRHVLATMSSAVVGDPKDDLTLAGVTGTNGKTTVTWLLDGILTRAGYSSSTIGTLTNAHTTPAPPELHRSLRAAADRAASSGRPGAVALEVSSHALDQGRVDGLHFAVAVFTNLSHEHLDYHGTMEAYFAAKARLFRPDMAARAVVCVDSPWGRRLATTIEVPLDVVDSADATVLGADVGTTTLEWRGMTVHTNLTGRINVPNTLVALAAAASLGVEPADAVRSLGELPGVPGRLELVGTGHPAVLVDYAHTPEALERALADLRELRGAARLHCVFGCGGDRDADKRPLMGSVASRLADDVIVTSDNPRSEDPDAIIDAVIRGVDGPATVRRIPDRAEAIAAAIASAADGDVVLIAGKGHETTQEVGEARFPFDDRVVAREVLEAGGRAC